MIEIEEDGETKRKTQRPWTQEEWALALKMRAAGEKYVVIDATLGRPFKSTECRFWRMKHRNDVKSAEHVEKQREYRRAYKRKVRDRRRQEAIGAVP